MRKEILLPALAVGGGAAGFFLRRWELNTAFEADTGLHIPGAPASVVLICILVALAVAFALLSLDRRRAAPGGYTGAFGAVGNTVWAVVMTAGALLLLCGAVLDLLGLPEVYAEAVIDAQVTHTNPFFAILARLLLGALALLSFPAVLLTVKRGYRGGDEERYSGALLFPAYTCCVWLIEAYQLRASDPVVLDYIYELLAIMAAMLALYFIAGFSFGKGKSVPASVFSALAVALSLTTMADDHPIYVRLLYGFVILYLTAHLAALHHNLHLRPTRAERNADQDLVSKPESEETSHE